eukprot:TRINITY_DN48134_c0_g1_i1.p1 TRINITY_DN48134_c0_g1~~TRINITY_DN48134_c0_g1_i1.p1  ORF type:complete len:188 (+),score=36.07 TRINITY_DN48134_c0_g1_i1:59-565(+)
MASGKWSKASLVALLAAAACLSPASASVTAGLLRGRGQSRSAGSPAHLVAGDTDDLQTEFGRVLLANTALNRTDVRHDQHAVQADAAFMPQCLRFTQALVYRFEGAKEKVAREMTIICARQRYPPDAQACGACKDTIDGHLHAKDAAWNLNGLSYQLLCTGISKAIAA